jgi:DNA-binding NtrC family response regulator
LVVGLRSVGGLDFALAHGRRWVIGSGASCDLVIDDPYVSTVHCIVERQTSGALVVRDRGSRNGTRVNGSVVEGAELRAGSALGIGRTSLVAVAARDGRPRAIDLLRGSDPVFRAAVEQAEKIAQTECSVLIVGETGTGKDLLARLVHEGSRRAAGKFVAVNCGAIPRELIASEMFGHEKGAFTGASTDRDGYFAESHGGTLFLDELGELPIEMQPHLLRVLESRRVRRVGGGAERAIDVRIVAATNQLAGLGTDSSRLRVDLYHRVATVVLVLPPLRERIGDVPDLVVALLAELEPEYGRKHVTDEAWHALTAYDWPGNVRELRQSVARAAALGGDALNASDFLTDLTVGRRTEKRTLGMPAITPSVLALPSSSSSSAAREQLPAPPESTIAIGGSGLAPYEIVIRDAMAEKLATYGSIRAAAQQLGMPKSTFADRARQWGLATTRRKPRLE